MHIKRHPINTLTHAYDIATKKVPINQETYTPSLENFIMDCYMIDCWITCDGGHVYYAISKRMN